MISPPALGAAAAGACGARRRRWPPAACVPRATIVVITRARVPARLRTVVPRTCIVRPPGPAPRAEWAHGYWSVSVPTSQALDTVSAWTEAAGHLELRDPARRARVAHEPSGGPGGQHANTSDTRVEVRFRRERLPVPRSAPARPPARAPRPGGRGRPRPTPARRRATARSPSNGCARASPTGCGSSARGAPPSRRRRRRRPASTPSAASRSASRTAAPPRPDHE